MKRWAFSVNLSVVNQPGTLERLARVFSERGINLGDILAVVGSDRLEVPSGQRPVIVLTFQCSERLKAFLHRRIQRMPEVASVVALERQANDERPVWALLPDLNQ
jgi:acetolactate synthase small subunit